MRSMTLILCALGCAVGTLAAPLRREQQKELWDAHVRGRPNPRIVDEGADWELIEGMVIIQQNSGLTPLGAALATVAFETGGVKVKDCALSPDMFERCARQMKEGELTPKETRAVRKLGEKASSKYWARHPGIKGKVVFDRTFGIRDAKLLQMTFGQEKDVVSALREVARYHGYIPVLERGEGLPFADFKEAIDKKVPVLLEEKRAGFKVAVGYVSTDGEQYLIVTDSANIPLEKRPMHILQSARGSNDPRVKAAVERRKKHLITSDYETGSDKGVPEGMAIIPYSSARELDAYLVHHWRASARAWQAKIAKILNVDKTESEPSWLS